MPLVYVPWLLLSMNETKFRMKGAEADEPLQPCSPPHPSSFSAASQLRHRPPVWANLSDALRNPAPRGTRSDYGVKLRGESSEGTCQRPGKTPPLRHCCLLMAHTPSALTLKGNPAFLRCLTAAGRQEFTKINHDQVNSDTLNVYLFKERPL